MNLLFTGRGGAAGSWEVRGRQVGVACGAKVKPLATLSDVQAADVTVVVKRVPDALLQSLRGRPWVYDIVDAYPQPESARWSQDEAIEWVSRHIARLNPTAVIWPNQRMRGDCDDGRPGLVLKHHHRPNILRNPIRKHVQAIGYEGEANYLDGWMPVIARECKRRGWKFVTNPAHLSDLDIVLAVRGGQWDGYATRNWKSAVKLANAHGSGTPFVGQRECGYLETASGAEYWADSPADLGACFDWLTDQSARELVSDRFTKKAYTVEHAATDLLGFLRAL
jgi:hypothetical protein